MGFEPMRLSTSELESDPLDHSGTCAKTSNMMLSIFDIVIIF